MKKYFQKNLEVKFNYKTLACLCLVFMFIYFKVSRLCPKFSISIFFSLFLLPLHHHIFIIIFFFFSTTLFSFPWAARSVGGFALSPFMTQQTRFDRGARICWLLNSPLFRAVRGLNSRPFLENWGFWKRSKASEFYVSFCVRCNSSEFLLYPFWFFFFISVLDCDIFVFTSRSFSHLSLLFLSNQTI